MVNGVRTGLSPAFLMTMTTTGEENEKQKKREGKWRIKDGTCSYLSAREWLK